MSCACLFVGDRNVIDILVHVLSCFTPAVVLRDQCIYTASKTVSSFRTLTYSVLPRPFGGSHKALTHRTHQTPPGILLEPGLLEKWSAAIAADPLHQSGRSFRSVATTPPMSSLNVSTSNSVASYLSILIKAPSNLHASNLLIPR